MNEADPDNWKPADFQKYVDVSIWSESDDCLLPHTDKQCEYIAPHRIKGITVACSDPEMEGTVGPDPPSPSSHEKSQKYSVS